jgi:hypothetical protein
MRYIGLLLNAPYKIDSMVWMWMVIRFFEFLSVRFSLCIDGYMNRRINEAQTPKMYVISI